MDDIRSFFARLDARTRLVILLSLVSGVGTYLGLMQLMEAGGGRSMLSALMAAVLTVLLQLLLVYALDQFLERREALPLAIYFVLVVGSVSMSQAFWMEALSLNQMVADQQYQRSLDRALDELRRSHHQFSQLSAIAARVSETSKKLAAREADRNQGYTCGRVRGGPGIRAEYRAADARRFESQAEAFALLKNQADELIGRASALGRQQPDRATIEAVKGLVASGNALMASPQIKAFDEMLLQRLREGRTGVVIRGQPVRCELEELADASKALRAIDFKAIPSVEVLDPSRNGATVMHAFRATLWFFMGKWEDRLETPQIVAIGMGALVDFAILWVMLSGRAGVHSILRRSKTLDQEQALCSTGGLYKHLTAEKIALILRHAVRKGDQLRIYLPLSLSYKTMAPLERLQVARFSGICARRWVPRRIRERSEEGEWSRYAVLASHLFALVPVMSDEAEHGDGEAR